MPRLRRRSQWARRTRTARPLASIALAAAFLLVAAACGDADDSATPSEQAPAPAGNQAEPIGPAAPGADGPLPAVDVVDIATGSTLSLTSYNTGQRPLLVWFWAPH